MSVQSLGTMIVIRMLSAETQWEAGNVNAIKDILEVVRSVQVYTSTYSDTYPVTQLH